MSYIGLIGLAVMGQNLARNISGKGFKMSVYNRTTETLNHFINQFGSQNLIGFSELKDFVESLETPRKIMIMVKAGNSVDLVIESLLPFLEKGDTLIDCGNTHYPDTIRREKYLIGKGIYFFGCGVSGGEEGALNGPSLMPGGDFEIWENLKLLLETISAKDFSGNPCVAYMGKNGAGHFVKMVHNGIEYAVMQMMAEAYELLSEVFELAPSQISDIFEKYNQGRLQSFLFEISVPILRRKDDFSDNYLIDKILDKAGQKGTGRWTAIEGLTQGADISVITQAVYARTVSSFKEKRVELATKYRKPKLKINMEVDDFLSPLENAIYGGMLVAYAQGFDLMARTAEEHGWNLNFSEISRIWQGGCIIRAQILNTLHQAFKNSQKHSLWEIPEIQKDLQTLWVDFRSVVAFGVQTGIPMYCLGAAVSGFEAMTKAKTSANFIQAQRDLFGAHTYERVDRDGSFHTEDWNE